MNTFYKKIITVGVIGLLFFVSIGLQQTYAAGSSDFVTTWRTTNPGSSGNTQIRIPTYGTGYNYTVDWGESIGVDEDADGIIDYYKPVISYNVTGTITHSYQIPGTYTVRISGSFPRIYFNNSGDKEKILSIQQWGTGAWTSMKGAFYGASNLTTTPSTANMSNVTDMSYAFAGASKFNASLNAWDTSNVTTMKSMFDGATSFNGDISSWDTSNVTDMSKMFRDAKAFNQNIGAWSNKRVTDMSEMFKNAISFNKSLNAWNTGNVLNMSEMFHGATVFNGSIAYWNTEYVQTMFSMFKDAIAFNQDLDDWDVRNVINLQKMFQNATAFNGDVGPWDTGEVTDMSFLFNNAISFNQNLDPWDVSKVLTMESMFDGATVFDGNIGGNTGSWETTNVTNMKNLFRDAKAFNQNINGWDVDSVITMESMFDGAISFNRDLGNWEVIKVLNMKNFLVDSNLSTPYYDSLLIGWNLLKLENGLTLDIGNTEYCEGEKERSTIISKYSWTINDGGLDCSAPSSPVTVAELYSQDDSGISDADGITSDATPRFKVNCTEADSIIKLYGSYPILLLEYSCTSVGIATLQVPPEMVDGEFDITYTEIDSSGNESAQSPIRAVTIDTVAPNAPSITTPSDGDPVHGIAEPNSTIQVQALNASCTDVAHAGTGEYSCVLSSRKAGDKISVTAIDRAGNISPERTAIISIGDLPDVPTIDPVAEGDESVSGTGEPETTILLINMSCSNEPVIVDDSGNWLCQNINPIPQNGTIIVVSSTNEQGNISAGSIISGNVNSSEKKVCRDTEAYNYSELGIHDESLCEYIYYVCRDIEALNYSRFGEHKQSKCNYADSYFETKTNALGLSDYYTNTTTNTYNTYTDNTYNNIIGLDPSEITDLNPFDGETCSKNLIISNNMQRGDENGKYSSYNKGVVTQVDVLQEHMNRLLLNQYGNQASGPVDGKFGSLTKRGVERLQKKLNQLLPQMKALAIDGIVGPLTKAAINNSC